MITISNYSNNHCIRNFQYTLCHDWFHTYYDGLGCKTAEWIDKQEKVKPRSQSNMAVEEVIGESHDQNGRLIIAGLIGQNKAGICVNSLP